jgi:glycosyltransferase involved in cell wall biosynthesis
MSARHAGLVVTGLGRVCSGAGFAHTIAAPAPGSGPKMSHQDTPRQPLSVVVITLNAAAQLAACLESARFAEELVVVDSGSEDDTVEIARAGGARVIKHEWLGFGPQKKFAVAQAAHDWVLCLDADERLTPELAASVVRELGEPRHAAYAMARRNRFLGRWLGHGEGYPDWSTRLFDRRRAQWTDDAVHEKVAVNGNAGRLAGDLLHESAESLEAYIAKQNRYTTLQAQALFAAGRNVSAAQLWLSPLARFVKFYLLRAGFLDGIPGFVHIAIGCFASFAKYAKLRALQQTPRRP